MPPPEPAVTAPPLRIRPRRPAAPSGAPMRALSAPSLPKAVESPSKSRATRTYLSEVKGQQVLVIDICDSDSESEAVIPDASTLPFPSHIDGGVESTTPTATARVHPVEKASNLKRARSKENEPERAVQPATQRTLSLRGGFGSHSKRPKVPVYESVPAIKRKTSALGASVSFSSDRSHNTQKSNGNSSLITLPPYTPDVFTESQVPLPIDIDPVDAVQGSQESTSYTSATIARGQSTNLSQPTTPRGAGSFRRPDHTPPSLRLSGNRSTTKPSSVTPRKRSAATRPSPCSSPLTGRVVSLDAIYWPEKPRLSIADILRNAQAEELLKQAARKEEHENRRERLAELEGGDDDDEEEEEEEEHLEDLSSAFAIQPETKRFVSTEVQAPPGRTTRMRTPSSDLAQSTKTYCRPAQNVSTSAADRLWRQLQRDEASGHYDATQRALNTIARMDKDEGVIGGADRHYPTPDSEAGSSDLGDSDVELIDTPSTRRSINDNDMGLQFLDSSKPSRLKVGMYAGEIARPRLPVWRGFWKDCEEPATAMRNRPLLALEGDEAVKDMILKAAEDQNLTVISTLLLAGSMQPLLQIGVNAISLVQWLLSSILTLEDLTQYTTVTEMICFILSRVTVHHLTNLTALLSSLLVAFTSMGPHEAIFEQATPPVSFIGDRQSACFALCRVVDSGIENGWLLGLETQGLATKLVLLACDATTSASLRGCIDDTLLKLWPLSLLEDSALSVALNLKSALSPYPASVRRHSLLVIARRTAEARDIGRWLALAYLVGDDIRRYAGVIAMLHHALQLIATELAKKSCDIEYIGDSIFMLTEAMTDIDALVDSCPAVPVEQHEVHKLRAMVIRTAHLINVQSGQSTKAVRNKSTLLQLGTVLKIKLTVALQRQARKNRESVKNLTEGEKGQLRLSFGAVVVTSEPGNVD